MVFISVLVFMA